MCKSHCHLIFLNRIAILQFEHLERQCDEWRWGRQFYPKIRCHGNVPWTLERSGKEGQITNLRSNTYHMVKISLKLVQSLDPEITG